MVGPIFFHGFLRQLLLSDSLSGRPGASKGDRRAFGVLMPSMLMCSVALQKFTVV